MSVHLASEEIGSRSKKGNSCFKFLPSQAANSSSMLHVHEVNVAMAMIMLPVACLLYGLGYFG